jgi:hypothetical protein
MLFMNMMVLGYLVVAIGFFAGALFLVFGTAGREKKPVQWARSIDYTGDGPCGCCGQQKARYRDRELGGVCGECFGNLLQVDRNVPALMGNGAKRD